MVYVLALVLVTPVAWAAEEYKISLDDLEKAKKVLDDPRPFLKELSFKKIMPPNVYSKLTHDVEAMKSQWAEIVGFRSPDVVGKIAPEIKPGTYNYKDKEKYPGLKELMIPELYKKFNPGAPPFAGNFPEIKIVPTKQRYWALPVAKATKKYEGTVKLDDRGCITGNTYVAGYPFPRPEGKWKAYEIIHNWTKRYQNEGYYYINRGRGYTSTHRVDRELIQLNWTAKLSGRVMMEPYGWLDERAKKQGEDASAAIFFNLPRDNYGMCNTKLSYLSPEKLDLQMVYIPGLRRVRLMSGTDVQDTVAGADFIYLDADGFDHRLSHTYFPYTCELIGEREYLIPIVTDGSGYLSSEGKELRNFEWERRPMYVVKTTSLDKNFVYQNRILYFDKETFMLPFVENYDRKGRLYRTGMYMYTLEPDMGLNYAVYCLTVDHIDLHSSYNIYFIMPATWITREHIDMSSLIKRLK